MAKISKIERAYARYVTLFRLVEAEALRARGRPTDERYLHLGITDPGDSPADAQKKIDVRLSELRDLIEHLGVLDISSSFELTFRQKISNSIGEARNAIEKQRKKSGNALAAPALVKELEEMQGLATIKLILAAGLSSEVKHKMDQIRKSRNDFTHGTDLATPPTINAKIAMDCLLDVFDSF